MSLYPPPTHIKTTVFASVPDRFRKKKRTVWGDTNRGGDALDCFLEGPSFDREGNLWVVAIGDIYFTDQGQTGLQDPTGRVYRWRDGALDLLIGTVPSPNGLVMNLAENQLLVAVTRAN